METSAIAGTGTVQGEEWKESVADPVADPVVRVTKQKQKRTNYGLAGTLYASGMGWDEIAKRVGSASGNTLRVAMFRKGVTKRSVRAQTVAEPVVKSLAAKVATVGAEMIREKLSGRLHDQIAHLSAQPVADLASKGQGEASTLKTMVDAFKGLHGGSESTVLVFGVDQIAERALEPVLDVQTTVTPDT